MRSTELVALLLFSLICSVTSEASDEPSVRIRTSFLVRNVDVGDTTRAWCEKKNIVEPVEWFTPSGEKVGISGYKWENNSRIYMQPNKDSTSMLLIVQTSPSTKLKDTGNWTCKAGDHSHTLEIIVRDTENAELTTDE